MLLVGLFGGYGIRFADSLTEAECRAAVVIAEAARPAACGLVAHTMYALHRSTPLEALGERGVPVVASLDVACRCVVELQRRGELLEGEGWSYVAPGRERSELVGQGSAATGVPEPDHPTIERVVGEDRIVLTEPEARAVLADSGIAFGPSVVAESADELVEAMGSLGGRVAVKLVCPAITHKSDAGGVVLDVATEAEARAAYDRIGTGARGHVGAARDHVADRDLDVPERLRVLVVPMLGPPRAELLVGAYRDPELGPVLTVGSGGRWVEALDDVALRVLPARRADIRRMLSGLRVWQILSGGRGALPVDPEPIVAVAMAVAGTIRGEQRIAEVEINPLFVYSDRVAPGDARIVLVDAR